MTPYRKR